MTKGLQETLYSNLTQPSVKVVDLIKITAQDGGRLYSATTFGQRIDEDLFFTNCEYDLIYDGLTFASDSGYISHSQIQESSKAANDQFEIIFTGLDVNLSADILDSKYAGSIIKVYKALITGTGNNLDTYTDSVGINTNVYTVFDGFVSTYSYTFSKESGTLSLICGGYFAAFEKKSLFGYSTVSSHQTKYPGDQSFEFAQISLNGIKWGID